jgi:hypothetical protein
MGRTTWRERWTTLRKILIKSRGLEGQSGDEDDVIGTQLDLGGNSRGKSATHCYNLTAYLVYTYLDVADARFSDKDLVSQGGLPGGQFGEVRLATCKGLCSCSSYSDSPSFHPRKIDDLKTHGLVYLYMGIISCFRLTLPCVVWTMLSMFAKPNHDGKLFKLLENAMFYFKHAVQGVYGLLTFCVLLSRERDPVMAPTKGR